VNTGRAVPAFNVDATVVDVVVVVIIVVVVVVVVADAPCQQY